MSQTPSVVHSSSDQNNLISGSRLGGFVEGEINSYTTVEDLIPASGMRPSKIVKQNIWDLPYEERKK
jgi:predicted esterase YcpF (UPF0227 family)